MVEAIVAASKDDASCVEQLIRSLSKVASDMKSYLAQKARQAEKDEAKKRKQRRRRLRKQQRWPKQRPAR